MDAQNCCLHSAMRGFVKIQYYCLSLINSEDAYGHKDEFRTTCNNETEQEIESSNDASRLSETERIRILLRKQELRELRRRRRSICVKQVDVLSPKVPYTGNWAADAYEVMRFDYYNSMMVTCNDVGQIV